MKTIFSLLLMLLLGACATTRCLAQSPNEDEELKTYQPPTPTPLNMNEIKRNIVIPSEQREACAQTKIVVKLQIDETGMPVKHQIIRPVCEWMTKFVETEVYKLRCKPALEGDKPVKAWLMVPFNVVSRR